MQPSSRVTISNVYPYVGTRRTERYEKNRAISDHSEQVTSLAIIIYFMSIVDQLVSMGVDRDIAAAAAAETGNTNIDAALALLFEADSGGLFPPSLPEPCKMTIAVNTSLGMSAGKIAAQCCHANLAAYKETVKRQTGFEEAWASIGRYINI